ncbi:hypothetical protein AVEN_137998-1, partial [Araneus ventricosus]
MKAKNVDERQRGSLVYCETLYCVSSVCKFGNASQTSKRLVKGNHNVCLGTLPKSFRHPGVLGIGSLY